MSDDVAAIEALIYQYGECVDAGDIDGIGELFANGSFKADGMDMEFTGADAVAGMFHQSMHLYDGKPATHHLFTNIVVDVNGDTATAKSKYTGFQALPDFSLRPIVAGRYHDKFERVNGEWRFAERLYMLDLAGDMSRHNKNA